MAGEPGGGGELVGSNGSREDPHWGIVVVVVAVDLLSAADGAGAAPRTVTP